MDALALLCNLHADGPATLQRLRGAGCDSLSSLLGRDADVLTEVMGWEERTAERFLREAGLLAERLEDADTYAEIDEEEDDELAGDDEEVFVALPSEVARGEDGEEEEFEEEGEYEEYEEADDDDELVLESTEDEAEETSPTVEAALGSWRQLDQEDPPAEPKTYVLPSTPLDAPDARHNRALGEVAIDGLSVELTERLSNLGVLTVRGLVEAPTLELAQRLGLGFTRLQRLQFLARRAWEELGPRPESGTLEASPPSEPPLAVAPPAQSLDAAGPFA